MISAMVWVSVLVMAAVNQAESLNIPGVPSAAIPNGMLTKEQRCSLPKPPAITRPYKVFLQSVDVMTANPEYIYFHEMKATKFNRTTPVLNCSFDILKEFPLEAESRVESYQLQGQRWDKSAVKVPAVRYCDFISTDLLFYRDLSCHGNFQTTCPVMKGNYFIHNYQLDTKNFPYDVPGGEDWRYNFIIAFGDVIICEVALTMKTEYMDKNIG